MSMMSNGAGGWCHRFFLGARCDLRGGINKPKWLKQFANAINVVRVLFTSFEKRWLKYIILIRLIRKYNVSYRSLCDEGSHSLSRMVVRFRDNHIFAHFPLKFICLTLNLCARPFNSKHNHSTAIASNTAEKEKWTNENKAKQSNSNDEKKKSEHQPAKQAKHAIQYMQSNGTHIVN